jgi:hypothetical protein
VILKNQPVPDDLQKLWNMQLARAADADFSSSELPKCLTLSRFVVLRKQMVGENSLLTSPTASSQYFLFAPAV